MLERVPVSELSFSDEIAFQPIPDSHTIKENNLKNTLEQEYKECINKFTNTLKENLERIKVSLNTKWNERRVVERSLWENKSLLEREKIRVTEQARIEIEKSKINSEVSTTKDQYITSLKEELNKELQELTLLQDKKVKEGIDGYKLELESKMRSEANRIQRQFKYNIKTKASFINLTKQNEIEGILSEKTIRTKQLNNKYEGDIMKMKVKYNKDMGELSVNNAVECDKELELKAELNKVKQKLSISRINFQNTLLEEETLYQSNVEKQLVKEKYEYEQNINKQLRNLNRINNIVNTKKIVEEIKREKLEVGNIKNMIRSKEIELEFIKDQSIKLQREINDFSNVLNGVSKNLKAEYNNNKYAEINRLRTEAKEKDNEVSRLIREYTHSNMHIDNLINEVKGIKQAIQTTNDLPNKSPLKEQKKSQRMLRKVQNAEEQLNAMLHYNYEERSKLENAIGNCKSDYEALLRLLHTLEKNKREWNQELRRSCIGGEKRGVLETVREKLNAQSNTLQNQANKVKAKLVQYRKQLHSLERFNNRLEICQRMKRNIEFITMVSCLLSEYQSFDLNDENEDLSNVDYEPERDIPYTSRFTIEGSKNVRKKSLGNIGKSVEDYRNMVKEINKRDIMRLAQKTVDNSKGLASEANWLCQMRTELTKTNYEFLKKH